MPRIPTRTHVHANDVRLALHQWPGSEPAVFFIHGTGFHGRCWDAVVEALPGRRCLAVDVRGHGYSETPPASDVAGKQPALRTSWSTLGADVTELVRSIELDRAIGVGHSMGGHLLTQAAAAAPHAFAGLVLIEPVILPRSVYRKQRPELTSEDVHFVARRRNRWHSAQEMIERLSDSGRRRGPFASWQPQVLADYCQHALQPAPDGNGLVLACPPALEASIYAGGASPDADVYHLLDKIEVPVLVLRAGEPQEPGSFDMQKSPTAPDLAEFFLNGRDQHFPRRTHFLPMENPELVARTIESSVAGIEEDNDS